MLRVVSLLVVGAAIVMTYAFFSTSVQAAQIRSAIRQPLEESERVIARSLDF